MRVLITEFIAEGVCELSGKSGECLQVVLDPQTPPAVVSTKEFIKLLRFHAQQQAKRTAQPMAAATREGTKA